VALTVEYSAARFRNSATDIWYGQPHCVASVTAELTGMTIVPVSGHGIVRVSGSVPRSPRRFTICRLKRPSSPFLLFGPALNVTSIWNSVPAGINMTRPSNPALAFGSRIDTLVVDGLRPGAY